MGWGEAGQKQHQGDRGGDCEQGRGLEEGLVSAGGGVATSMG